MTITTTAADEPDDEPTWEPPPGPRPLNPFMPAQQQHPSGQPDDSQGESGPDDSQSEIAYLRAKARLADQRFREVEALDRKIAIRESGVDIDHPHGKLFLKAMEKDGVLDQNPTSEEIRSLAEQWDVPMRDES